jgi:hypothetical protein
VGAFCSGGKLGGKAPNDTQKWENAVIMAPTYLAFRGYIPLWVKFFFLTLLCSRENELVIQNLIEI